MLSIELEFHRTFAVRVAGAAPEGLPGILAGLRRAQAHQAATNGTRGRLRYGMIRLMGQISPIRLILFPFLQSGGGELLAVSALINKGRFQTGDLAVEEEVRLVDDADQRIGANGGVFVVKPGGIECPALGVGEISQICRIGQIGLIFFKCGGNTTHSLRFRAFPVPLGETAVT